MARQSPSGFTLGPRHPRITRCAASSRLYCLALLLLAPAAQAQGFLPGTRPAECAYLRTVLACMDRLGNHYSSPPAGNDTWLRGYDAASGSTLGPDQYALRAPDLLQRHRQRWGEIWVGLSPQHPLDQRPARLSSSSGQRQRLTLRAGQRLQQALTGRLPSAARCCRREGRCRRVALHASEDRLGQALAMAFVHQPATIAAIRDEAGLHQDRRDVRRLEHGEAGLLDTLLVQRGDVRQLAENAVAEVQAAGDGRTQGAMSRITRRVPCRGPVAAGCRCRSGQRRSRARPSSAPWSSWRHARRGHIPTRRRRVSRGAASACPENEHVGVVSAGPLPALAQRDEHIAVAHQARMKPFSRSIRRASEAGDGQRHDPFRARPCYRPRRGPAAMAGIDHHEDVAARRGVAGGPAPALARGRRQRPWI